MSRSDRGASVPASTTRAVTKAIFGGEEKPTPPRVEAPTIVLRSPDVEIAPSHMVPKPDIPVIKDNTAETSDVVNTSSPVGRDDPARRQSATTPAMDAISAPAFRLIGEALNTYIIVETEGSLLLIDKHAAHERMIFDRLQRDREAMSQSLLIPVTWRPDPESLELIELHGEALSRAGFEIEPYGAQEVIIRAVPADTDGSEIAMLEEIVAALHDRRTENPMDRIFHTIACKAAIKAGWKTERAELEVLVEKVVSGEVRYCPHGRPVSVKLTRAELDKFFKRIV